QHYSLPRREGRSRLTRPSGRRSLGARPPTLRSFHRTQFLYRQSDNPSKVPGADRWPPRRVSEGSCGSQCPTGLIRSHRGSAAPNLPGSFALIEFLKTLFVFESVHAVPEAIAFVR